MVAIRLAHVTMAAPMRDVDLAGRLANRVQLKTDGHKAYLTAVEDAFGAVHGYRGLVRELIAELKRELKMKHLPVMATGGYAKLIVVRLPEIIAVESNLTLEGLRLAWDAARAYGHW